MSLSQDNALLLQGIPSSLSSKSTASNITPPLLLPGWLSYPLPRPPALQPMPESLLTVPTGISMLTALQQRENILTARLNQLAIQRYLNQLPMLWNPRLTQQANRSTEPPIDCPLDEQKTTSEMDELKGQVDGWKKRYEELVDTMLDEDEDGDRVEHLTQENAQLVKTKDLLQEKIESLNQHVQHWKTNYSMSQGSYKFLLEQNKMLINENLKLKTEMKELKIEMDRLEGLNAFPSCVKEFDIAAMLNDNYNLDKSGDASLFPVVIERNETDKICWESYLASCE